MNVDYYEINNISIGPVITVFMAQLNVEFGDGENSINSSFNIEQFQETLDTFHQLQGDILIFPEYYLPPDRLPELVELVQHSNELNRIYLVPLSQLGLPEFEQLQRQYKIISEKIVVDGAWIKKTTLNMVLILVKDSCADLKIFSQFKTLPSIQETKPHPEIYRARYLHIFKIDQVLSFAVPICFSFIGKEYDNIDNLEPLIPYIESGTVDYLFVPQLNPKPLHWTFVKAINHICEVSKGTTGIFLTNVAGGIGRSSIVDLFSEGFLTSEYDCQELEYPGYRHLIFVSPSERLCEYKCILPRQRKGKLSPEFVREVDVDIFSYDTNGKKWVLRAPQIIYPYKSASKYSHIKFSHEVNELRSSLQSDISHSLDYIRTISRQKELGNIDGWEDLAGQVFFLTDVAAKGGISLGPGDLVWLLKLVGEYHELRGCNLAAYYFYDMMNSIAYSISSKLPVLVSDYLLMRVCSRHKDKEAQNFALSKARMFFKLATDPSEDLSCLGPLLPTILIESAMIISWFNETHTDVYLYGSYASAVNSIEYNANEVGKQNLVSQLLTQARRQIEAYGLNMTPRDYLRYLDVSGLTSLVLGKDKEAERFAQSIRTLDPRRLGAYGNYLASKHNETLLLQIQGEKKAAERQYLELIQEHREYLSLPSLIAAQNLSDLLEDKEVARYLLDVSDRGNPQWIHRESSLMKARKLYQFGKWPLKQMR